MKQSEQSPITDSVWFFVLAFSLMALLALAVVFASGKYGKRQATIERQFQARQRVAEGLVLDERSNAKVVDANKIDAARRTEDGPTARPYSSSDRTLLPLWPLAVLLAASSLVAAMMLWRDIRKYNTLDATSR